MNCTTARGGLRRSSADMGVEKGDRVAIMLPNCPQFTIAFFGILLAGGIAVPTSPLYTASEAELQLKNAGVKVVVGLGRLAPLLAQSGRRCGTAARDRHVVAGSSPARSLVLCFIKAVGRMTRPS